MCYPTRVRPGEYITADTHFGHKAIIRYSARPFQSVDEMDDAMVRAWNSKVPSGAVVYHLGDLSFHSSGHTIGLIRRLNGTIRLVRGNHDRVKPEVAVHLDWVRDLYEPKLPDGRRLVMCHYPMLSWRGSHRGNVHVHGHCHGSLMVHSTSRVDVGVDTTEDYAPLSYDELMARFDGTTYEVVDRHEPRR